MSEYQIGRDLEKLEQRIAALEEAVDQEATLNKKSDVRVGILQESKADPEAKIRASKTFQWDQPDRLGECELRGGYTLTIFDDGRWRAIGRRKCNAGGIISCKEFDVSVELYRGSCESNPPAVVSFRVQEGLLGPGSEPPTFQGDGRDDIIRDLYREINCAAMWVSRCRTGV